MKRLKASCRAVFWAFFLCFCLSSALATTSVPDNPTTTSPDSLDLSDGTITNPYGGCPSGTTPAIVESGNWGTETLRYGECVNTFAISYAINQALQGSGVSVDKVHYSWKYIHCFNTPDDFCSDNISNRVNTQTGEITDDTYWDELVVTVEVTDASGTVVETKTWTMDKWYDWNNANSHSTNEINVNGIRWQIHEDNIEIYNHIDKVGTIRTPNQLGDVRFRVVGNDGGNWDGYYGPVIRDFQTWFTYRANPCNDTALYDPSCPGYAEAYATYEYDQNCAANALYDPGCPDYADAYYNQQCSADPLYDSGCPGYASAYYDQQCSADPLYDSGCDGYEQAYYNQQCSLDAHYDSSCPNYNWANTDYTMDLENRSNNNDFIEIRKADNSDVYWALYYNESELDSGEWVAKCKTYDNGCEDAVITGVTFNGGPNPYVFLYTKDKDGNIFYPTNGHKYRFMTDTKLDTLCDSNALYSPMCDGYETAYAQYEYEQQCQANPLYDSGCPGYNEAYYDYQCQANPLYDTGCPGYSTAYYNQQCEADPLYDSGCSGYETAYYNQQCSIDPLYAETCPGYNEAYFTQQCNADPLYDSNCSGYEQAYYTQQCEANPLYDSGCPGYEGAYFTQQCELDNLYSPQCDGYDTAYFNQQCGLDTLYDTQCPGYDEAYLNYQCGLDPLYDASCTGYYEAQCDANPLYDFLCTGYQQAYFDQQCLYNPQYDTQCPGYIAPIVAEPEPVENVTSTGDAVVDSVISTPAPEIIIPVPIPEPQPIPVPLPVIEIEEVDLPEVTIESIELEVEAQIEAELQESIIEEPVIEETIVEEIVVDEPEIEEEPVNTVEDISNDEGTSEEVSENSSIEEDIEDSQPEEVTEEEADKSENEESTEEESSDNVEQQVGDGDGDEESDSGDGDEGDSDSLSETSEAEAGPATKPATKKKVLTEKQKEAAKRKKMKEIIKRKLSKLADTMGKAATLEQQQALQAQISALINFVPGFNAYGQLQLFDGDIYQDEKIYEDKKVPENQRGLRNGLANEILHNKMVDMQYEGMD